MGSLIPFELQGPLEPSLNPPQGSMGAVLRSRQEGGEWKEIILCSLAHSHIKSNSFIFTFIHLAGPGRGGWGGGSLKDFSGRGLSGGKSVGAGPYAKGSPSSSSGPRPRSSLFSSVLAREWRLPWPPM